MGKKKGCLVVFGFFGATNAKKKKKKEKPKHTPPNPTPPCFGTFFLVFWGKNTQPLPTKKKQESFWEPPNTPDPTKPQGRQKPRFFGLRAKKALCFFVFFLGFFLVVCFGFWLGGCVLFFFFFFRRPNPLPKQKKKSR